MSAVPVDALPIITYLFDFVETDRIIGTVMFTQILYALEAERITISCQSQRDN